MPRLLTIAAGAGTHTVLAQMEKGFAGGITDFVKSGVVSLGFAIIL